MGSVSREHILAEIRRTAAHHGGKPLGMTHFAEYTGIDEADVAQYWAHWGEAVREAGYDPAQMLAPGHDDRVFAPLVKEIRRLGRMPTVAEQHLARKDDSSFPDEWTLAGWGGQAGLAQAVVEYCDRHAEAADVLPMVQPLAAKASPPDDEAVWEKVDW